MSQRAARALVGVVTVGLVAALFIGAMQGAVPGPVMGLLFFLIAVVAMGAQFALVFVPGSPRVERLVEGLSELGSLGSSQWSVGGVGEASPLTDGFALRAEPASAPLHGTTGAARVAIAFDRVRVAGPLTVPLTVVTVFGVPSRGVTAAYRGTGGRDSTWARFARGLESPRIIAKQWTVAASREALDAVPEVERVLHEVSDEAQAVIWSRSAMHLVIPGHVQRPTTLQALTVRATELARLSGH